MARIFDLIRAAPSVASAVEAVRDYYGISHVTYHVARHPSAGVDNPWVRTTYPSSWVGFYVLRNFVSIDPVIRAGIDRLTPFQWDSLINEQGYAEVFDAAEEYGIGRRGYSIPITDRARRRALLTLSDKCDVDQWLVTVEAHAIEWIELAHALHKRAVVEAFGGVQVRSKLTPRETDCLLWAARGKAAEEIAIILSISEHTVRAYLKSARYKLDCSNISQAVAIAIRQHIIEP